MEALALKDPAVRRTVGAETIAALDYDFADGYEEAVKAAKPGPKAPTVPDNPEEEPADPLEWMTKLDMDGRGSYKSSATNLNLILSHDPHIGEVFAYNSFDFKRYLMRAVPWRVITSPEPIKSVDYSGLRNYIETVYAIASTGKIDDCMALEFEKNTFHPVRDYLDGLTWDGTARMDSLLVDYFGAADNEYTREAMRKVLTGAVARVREPGCKFDLVMVLVSDEGTGKSTFIRKLGNGWSSDSFHTVQGTRAFEQLQGAWLIEMAELSGMRKADVEAVKHFITIQTDSFRPAYARVQEDFPRQCIFIATTNKTDFLQADNNNRRFMPVDVHPRKVTKSVWDISQEEIGQIWAEAVDAYEVGERLYLTGAAEALAKTERRAHSELDERHGLLVRYLDTYLPTDWAGLDIYERRQYLDTHPGPAIGLDFEDQSIGTVEREYVCVAEVWAECFGNDPGKIDQHKTKEINALLRGLDGWSAAGTSKRFGAYGTQRYYAREII
jgi:predicted P-loop ATPase